LNWTSCLISSAKFWKVKSVFFLFNLLRSLPFCSNSRLASSHDSLFD
jgi:hypothetical protein